MTKKENLKNEIVTENVKKEVVTENVKGEMETENKDLTKQGIVFDFENQTSGEQK